MNFFSGLLNGFQEAWENKFRSLLSMMGIILGVASLVAMMGVAEGLIRDFRAIFERSGGIERVSIDQTKVPEWQKTRASISSKRTLRDLDAILDNVTLADYATAQFNANWKEMIYGNRKYWSQITGVTTDYQPVFNVEVADGRFIADIDVHEAQRVAVIGTNVLENMFPKDVSPVGLSFNIAGLPYRIVGVLKKQMYIRGGRNILDRLNQVVYIPVTAAQSQFGKLDEVHGIYLKANNVAYLSELVSQTENTLLATHRGIHDIEVKTREEDLIELKKNEAGFKYSIGSLAIISLIIGGIGITNVMLASINERIREIGVRKAVGARSSDVFLQFIAESISISLIGGVLGILFSFALVNVVMSIMPPNTVNIILTTEAFLLGFGASVFTGVVSGIYPAFKAAKLDPITALRYE